MTIEPKECKLSLVLTDEKAFYKLLIELNINKTLIARIAKEFIEARQKSFKRRRSLLIL